MTTGDELAERLFVGDDSGLKSVAVMTSLCASAKRHGLNPWADFNDATTQLAAKPANVNHLLPEVRAKHHLSANR